MKGWVIFYSNKQKPTCDMLFSLSPPPPCCRLHPPGRRPAAAVSCPLSHRHQQPLMMMLRCRYPQPLGPRRPQRGGGLTPQCQHTPEHASPEYGERGQGTVDCVCRGGGVRGVIPFICERRQRARTVVGPFSFLGTRGGNYNWHCKVGLHQISQPIVPNAPPPSPARLALRAVVPAARPGHHRAAAGSLQQPSLTCQAGVEGRGPSSPAGSSPGSSVPATALAASRGHWLKGSSDYKCGGRGVESVGASHLVSPQQTSQLLAATG